MVDELLAEGDAQLGTLDAIAFGRGPGAFTGVRLAATVAQGLAFGARVPVVPVSDLRALAQRALDEDRGLARVLVCTDARMREVYWACFERASDSLAVPCGEERVSAPADVRLPSAWGRAGQGAGRLAGVGSGFAAYPELCREFPPEVVLPVLLPRATEIVQLAVPEVEAGRVFPPEQALPVYLRDDVARPRSAPSSN
jgi:tRNA threonylcarbamoyladenosine biosynthesis protein TsaB